MNVSNRMGEWKTTRMSQNQNKFQSENRFSCGEQILILNLGKCKKITRPPYIGNSSYAKQTKTVFFNRPAHGAMIYISYMDNMIIECFHIEIDIIG